MSTCTGVRAGVQSATDFVRNTLIYSDRTASGIQLTVGRTSADLEMTVNILIQIDKLVQLLESPVFTCEQS